MEGCAVVNTLSMQQLGIGFVPKGDAALAYLLSVAFHLPSSALVTLGLLGTVARER